MQPTSSNNIAKKALTDSEVKEQGLLSDDDMDHLLACPPSSKRVFLIADELSEKPAITVLDTKPIVSAQAVDTRAVEVGVGTKNGGRVVLSRNKYPFAYVDDQEQLREPAGVLKRNGLSLTVKICSKQWKYGKAGRIPDYRMQIPQEAMICRFVKAIKAGWLPSRRNPISLKSSIPKQPKANRRHIERRYERYYPAWIERCAYKTLIPRGINKYELFGDKEFRRHIYVYRIDPFRPIRIGKIIRLTLSMNISLLRSDYNGNIRIMDDDSVAFLYRGIAVAALKDVPLASLVRAVEATGGTVTVMGKLVDWYDKDEHWPSVNVDMRGDADLNFVSSLINDFGRWPLTYADVYEAHYGKPPTPEMIPEWLET